MSNIYDERRGDIPDKPPSVPAQVPSPLIYYHMFARAVVHAVVSVLGTCTYLARLSFEIKRADTNPSRAQKREGESVRDGWWGQSQMTCT